MPKATTSFRCQACGATTGKWYGRCPKCGEFSTIHEQAQAPATSGLKANAKGSQQIVIPAGNKVAYGTPIGTGELLLLKAKQRLYPGSSITITFTFAQAGSVTATVPVQLSDNAGTETVPEPSTTAEN